jgi:hypothetical protein
MTRGSYVTPATTGKVEDELRADEEVQFIARGNKIERSYRGSTETLGYLRGRPWLVATGRRVFLKIPKAMSNDIDSFAYDELAGADLGNGGLTGTRVEFRTVRGEDYSFRADKPAAPELEMMAEFVRERASGQQSPGDAPPASADPTRHQTQSCRECGGGVNEDVSRCPNCGFAPADHKKWALIHLLLGTVSAPTVVGPLLFGLKMASHWRKYRRGVTG